MASLHSIAFACGVIAMGLIAVRVLRRARRSGAVRLGMIAMAAGVAVMIVGPWWTKPPLCSHWAESSSLGSVAPS